MILLKKRIKTIKEAVQLSEFTEWLIAEKDKRGWDDSMLAARAEVSPSIVSMVLSEQKSLTNYDPFEDTERVMVRYYAKVAEVDTAKVHERAGPVDNWLR